MKPAEVSEFLEQCPEPVLKQHPLALLVLMRRMFTWRQIPTMIETERIADGSHYRTAGDDCTGAG